MRVVRAKALNRSKVLKDKAISAIVGFLPGFFASFKTVQQFIQDYIQRFLRYFELEKPTGLIASDISDYLTNTRLTIEKLPYIYQRLFSFEPLETFELYIERKPQMEEIERAYSRWKEEKFAPVVIIGRS